MDVGIIGQLGIGLGSISAGLGVARFFFSGARAIERVPEALERIAAANESQAEAARQAAALTATLYDLRESQEQIRISLSVLAEKMDEVERGRHGL